MSKLTEEHYEQAITIGVDAEVLERTEGGFKLNGTRGENFANSCLLAAFKAECDELLYVYGEEGYKKFKEEKCTSHNDVMTLVLQCLLQLASNAEEQTDEG